MDFVIDNKWLVETDLFYQNANANNFTWLWTLILAMDIVVSLSYTLFPKKNKSHSNAT
ncbi:hypothetical protein [Bacillus sp. NEB1478]|uniref:hypothetical protein n=1 Tax=Bacillus sp. NEB1478 TaxID=3073816 RepID=UPI00287327F3|nr:hypothetical protein [Bacillus sp. NEB1478]WNB91207.1 hypothetical protein RGB74_15025 [Bacillus sp. NEB1478]